MKIQRQKTKQLPNTTLKHSLVETEESPDEIVSTGMSQITPNDMETMGQFMADAFGRAVSYLMQHGSKSREEAETEVLSTPSDIVVQRIMNALPERVTYLDMIKLQSKDPQLAARRWETIKQRAVTSWRDGEGHARALSQTDEEYVWKLANLIAVRESLSEGCEPRTGMETELINQMAQLQILQMQWMQIMVERTHRDFVEKVGLKKKLVPQEVNQVQAVEHAAAMVERLQRLFLRAHRAFQESRKQVPVMVQNAGQVNVAQQQVNISK